MALSSRKIPAYSWLLWLTMGLICLGLVMVYSASGVGTAAANKVSNPNSFIIKQMIAVLLGLGTLYTISSLRVEALKSLIKPLWLLSVLLLALVMIPGIGVSGNGPKGAVRWISLGGFSFQPSEVFKLVDVLLFAGIAGKICQNKGSWKSLIGLGIITTLPLVMVYKQPDLGTVILIGAVLFALVFMCNMPLQIIPSLMLVGTLFVYLAVTKAPWRTGRLLAFARPEEYADAESYQVMQSLQCFGSGGIFGMGLGQGRQKNLLPEGHTDYIISVVGEELGFIAVLLVILAFAGIGLLGIYVARQQEDISSKMIVIGTDLILVLPAFINIAMTSNLLPSKGLALPFMSYGGSSMIISCMAVGVLCCFARELEEDKQ